jgi:hypothetical protein
MSISMLRKQGDCSTLRGVISNACPRHATEGCAWRLARLDTQNGHRPICNQSRIVVIVKPILIYSGRPIAPRKRRGRRLVFSPASAKHRTEKPANVRYSLDARSSSCPARPSSSNANGNCPRQRPLRTFVSTGRSSGTGICRSGLSRVGSFGSVDGDAADRFRLLGSSRASGPTTTRSYTPRRLSRGVGR